METVDIDLNKKYTYADYLTWLDDKRRELINGLVHLMTPAPRRRHQGISFVLGGVFFNYLKDKNCKAYTAPFDVRLPKNGETADKQIYTVVQPDISIICDQNKLDDRGCIGAPDLIVEILSPATAKKDIDDKFKLYEQSGVKEYWIVNPNDENINVFVRGKEGKYQLQGMYAGDMKIKISIFEDLVVNVEDIFNE